MLYCFYPKGRDGKEYLPLTRKESGRSVRVRAGGGGKVVPEPRPGRDDVIPR